MNFMHLDKPWSLADKIMVGLIFGGIPPFIVFTILYLPIFLSR